MKARIKFKRIYNQLPPASRRGLICLINCSPYSLAVCDIEIDNDTELGKRMLRELGFKDD